MLIALQQNLLLLIMTSGLVGLIVGSFLNVVIHRTPRMLMRQWQQDCHELAGNTPVASTTEPYNLVVPRSQCPHCGHTISAIENIPVFSWLWLRRKCSACQAPISARYPLVEILTATLTAVTVWKLGYSLSGLAGVVLLWMLIAVTFIDIDHHLLPDVIVLPFLWLGLLLNLNNLFTSLPNAVIGAAAGYLSLWLIFHLFRLITGKEGMGYGDFKLFAVFGAWLGWQSLFAILLISSFVGAVVGLLLIMLRKQDRSQPIPFGPYLASAGWITMMWGDELTRTYFQIAEISF